MAKTKIQWAKYVVEDNKKDEVYFEELDKDLYDSKYKKNLYCINGCKAKIKFTHRKDGTKFFSTWNNEGNLHKEDCEFHVRYNSKMARKKLIAKHEKNEVSDEHILNTIKNRIKNMKDKKKKEPFEDKDTKKIENSGEKEVSVPVEGDSGDGGTAKRVYIGSLDAEHITEAYVDTRKCVYGRIENIQFNTTENGESYAYFNLKNKYRKVSVHIPPAFYYKENNNLEKFKRFIKILQEKINGSENDFIFVGVGFIRNKKKKGLNLRIINKDHFLINETSHDSILNNRAINNINYSY